WRRRTSCGSISGRPPEPAPAELAGDVFLAPQLVPAAPHPTLFSDMRTATLERSSASDWYVREALQRRQRMPWCLIGGGHHGRRDVLARASYLGGLGHDGACPRRVRARRPAALGGGCPVCLRPVADGIADGVRLCRTRRACDLACRAG